MARNELMCRRKTTHSPTRNLLGLDHGFDLPSRLCWADSAPVMVTIAEPRRVKAITCCYACCGQLLYVISIMCVCPF